MGRKIIRIIAIKAFNFSLCCTFFSHNFHIVSFIVHVFTNEFTDIKFLLIYNQFVFLLFSDFCIYFLVCVCIIEELSWLVCINFSILKSMNIGSLTCPILYIIESNKSKWKIKYNLKRKTQCWRPASVQSKLGKLYVSDYKLIILIKSLPIWQF